MGRIILARHGEDEDNAAKILNGRRDKPLTLKGLSQAVGLARKVQEAGLKIGYIFSSELVRAQQSAVICATMLEVPHLALDFLIERSHGILEGCNYSDIPLLAKSWREAYGFTYVVEVEGGESYL